jgi:hypothetical protein
VDATLALGWTVLTLAALGDDELGVREPDFYGDARTTPPARLT